MATSFPEADSHYKGFSPFSVWAGCPVEDVDVELAATQIGDLRESQPAVLQRALNYVRRAAAVQTGAIEGLYEADRGFTITIACQMALVEQALAKKPRRARTMIEDQMAAYEHVLDFATSSVPIAEVWIRELHRDLCRGQKTYTVHTDAGPQDHELPLGTYKASPNHVRLKDASIHSYAPVAETATEVRRLVEEFQTADFQAAHPILQAAYAHHALTVVHPFADGNGRVARALASVFTYRRYSLPFFVLTENKTEYLDALSDADSGEFLPLVSFIARRLIDATDFVKLSMEFANSDQAPEAAPDIGALYRSVKIHGHETVDHAAHALMSAFEQALRAEAEGVASDTDELSAHVRMRPEGYQPIHEGYRVPVNPPGNRIRLMLTTIPPADARLVRHYHVEVPRNSGAGEKALIVRSDDHVEIRSVSVTELVSGMSASSTFMLTMVAQQQVAEALRELEAAAERSLRAKGY